MATTTAGVSPATVVYDAQAVHRGHPHQQAFYSLRPGVDDNNLFSIDPTTGAVTFNASPTYHPGGDNTYDIVVTAHFGDQRVRQVVEIKVTDVAPTTPVDANPAPNIVAEGAPAGTSVGLTASSTDAAGEAITYSLTADSSGGGFAINPTTGVVTVANPSKIDYVPSGGSFDVTVQASDAAGASTPQTFKIAVDPGSTVSYGPAPVVAKGGSASETPSVSSPEGGDHFALASSGTGTYGTASVNATSGIVSYTASGAPAAGTTATDSFTITDTDAYGAQTHATASFTVDGGSAVSYAPAPVVANGHSASDSPTVTSPEGGDTFVFASGGTSATGSYGTATLNATSGVVTYTASSAAAGTAATDSFAIVDTDKYGVQTHATASFTADGGSAVTYATQAVPPGQTVSDTPTVTSPEGGDTFSFVGGSGPGATEVTGSFGTATINSGTGVITYTASQGASGTTTLTVSDTDHAGATTTTTASFDDTDTWIGGADGDWQTGSNWSFGAPPENDTALIPSGSTPEILSPVTLDAVALSNSGTIGVAAAQTFTLMDGTSITGGALTIMAAGPASGTIDIEGPTGATLNDVALTGNGGTIEIGMTSAATLTLEGGTTITSASVTTAAPGSSSGGALDIGGPSSGATLDGDTVSNNGAINIGSTAFLNLDDDTTITGGTLAIGNGTLMIEKGAGAGVSSAELDEVTVNNNNGTIVVATGATLTLNGDTVNGNNGTINVLNGATLTLNGGAVNNDNSTINVAAAATLNGATLNNESGEINLAPGATLTLSSATLNNENNSAINVGTGATLTLNGATLSSPSGSLGNEGTVAIEGKSTLTLASAVTGTGTIMIGSGATLDVTDMENQTIYFPAATQTVPSAGTLQIDDPADFTATISAASGQKLAMGDVFDFPSLNYETTTATTGPGSFSESATTTTLTVTDAGTVYKFTLDGNYSGSTFTVKNDGTGGADIADPPASAPSGDHVVTIDRGEHEAGLAPDHASAPPHGLSDADHFVFDTPQVAHAAGQQITGLAGHVAAHDGVIDVAAIVSALQASGVPAQTLFEAVENAAGTAAALEVNKGTVAAPHWVAIAHLDGLHPGDAVALAYDAAHPADVTHIQVEAHALTGHLG